MVRLMLVGLILLAGGRQAPQAPNTLSAAEQQAGWKLLFDGKTLAGWHGYGKRGVPDGWQVVDGAITRTGEGGDLVTDARYGDFELEVDWNIAPGGNSGIFYRGVESKTPEKRPIYFSAPEMQVLDDARHADGRSPLTSAGSCFGLYPAPRGVVRPAGQWNHARIVVRDGQVQHWLNGTKVVEYMLGGADWKARVAKSKFAAWQDYGKAAAGVIALQDHGNRVEFRSLKILSRR